MSLLSWSSLLAQSVEFAQAAAVLPRDEHGDRWRAASAPIIALNALIHALSELGSLSDTQRAVGLDQASILIRRHASELHGIWRTGPVPDEVALLIEDARAALSAWTDGGQEWRLESERATFEHPGPLAVALAQRGLEADLLLPVPGVTFFRGAPVAFLGAGPSDEQDWAVEAVGGWLAGATRGLRISRRRVARARQVYRQLDFASGRIARDVVAPLDATLPAGQPLLCLALSRGEVQPIPMPPRIDPVHEAPQLVEED
ncbi:MAG: hypothetical protein H6811_06235 [Phycisphaeraceae bacterium]|nr:hypothetical protein [Phycisphaeraceae bacterium]